MLDYMRIGTAVPAVKVADVAHNAQEICTFLEKAEKQQVDLLLFPELALTGYSCGDLFFQERLHQAVDAGVRQILACSQKYPQVTAVVGLPVNSRVGVLNCAAVIRDGSLWALVGKQYLPDSGECQESRWFTALEDEVQVTLAGQQLAVSIAGTYQIGHACVGIEICEDFLAPVPPSAQLALSGAEVICNLSASPEFAGKKAWRESRIRPYSQRFKCVYAYCSAGYTESTSDMVFSGHSLIVENGTVLAQSSGTAASASPEFAGKKAWRESRIRPYSQRFKCVYAYCSAGYTESTSDMVFSGHSLIVENGTVLAQSSGTAASDYRLVSDCDLGRIRADRRVDATFRRCASRFGLALEPVPVWKGQLRGDGTAYPVDRHLGRIRADRRVDATFRRCASRFGLALEPVPVWKGQLRGDGTAYPVDRQPFLPQEEQARRAYCRQIFQLQVTGLKQRLAGIGANAVVGISGGLDSTLALLVCHRAAQLMRLSPEHILPRRSRHAGRIAGRFSSFRLRA